MLYSEEEAQAAIDRDLTQAPFTGGVGEEGVPQDSAPGRQERTEDGTDEDNERTQVITENTATYSKCG